MNLKDMNRSSDDLKTNESESVRSSLTIAKWKKLLEDQMIELERLQTEKMDLQNRIRCLSSESERLWSENGKLKRENERLKKTADAAIEKMKTDITLIRDEYNEKEKLLDKERKQLNSLIREEKDRIIRMGEELSESRIKEIKMACRTTILKVVFGLVLVSGYGVITTLMILDII